MTATNALVAGRCDAALAPLLDWIPAFYAREDYRQNARLICGIRSGSFRLLIRRSLPMYKISELSGIRIGITRKGGADQRFVSIWLRRHSLHPTRSVQWIELEPHEMADALRAGRVDAIAAHDPTGWRVYQETKEVTRQILGSTSGAERARTDFALGISQRALQDDPALAEALVNALHTAQSAFAKSISEIVSDWSRKRDAPPEPTAMLRQKISRRITTSKTFRVQVEQYIDEFKLIGLVRNEDDAGQIAREICVRAP